MKIFAGIFMVIFALTGLAATSCGAIFIQEGVIALIGIIPGLIFIWVSWMIWKENFGKKEAVQVETGQSDTE
jgi:cadmium resistance protein CadD (predicted permease)